MTTTSATLPNAALIDEVMASLQTEPQKWDAAWDAARDAAWDAARDAAWDAAWGAAWDAVRDAARDAAWGAARCVLAALIAYDDAGRLLKAPPDLLRTMHRLDPHPMYLLLLPAAFVFTEVSS